MDVFSGRVARLLGSAAAFVSLIAAQAPTAPPAADSSQEQEIVVTALHIDRDIVVRAPPHCHRRPGDPLDAFDAASHSLLRPYQVIVRDHETGLYGLVRDDEFRQFVEGDEWQRAGSGIEDFVFRAPLDGTPLCIGAHVDHPRGSAQLRRNLRPGPYVGRHVRFTAFVASRAVDNAGFWITDGAGGVQRVVSITGTHGWTPVSVELIVHRRSPRLSYGIGLGGTGDIWFTQPRLEIVDERPGAPPPGASQSPPAGNPAG